LARSWPMKPAAPVIRICILEFGVKKSGTGVFGKTYVVFKVNEEEMSGMLKLKSDLGPPVLAIMRYRD
jgi:hypothetical protein